MMDALSAPRLPVSDGGVPPSSAGRSDKADENGGFSKVLSSSGQQERGSRDGEAGAGDGSDMEMADGEMADTATSAALKRPLIDLSHGLVADLDALPADISVDELARLLAAAKVQAKGKGQTAETSKPEVEIQGLDPKLKAELAKAMAAVRGEKGTREEVSVDAGQSAASTNEPETGSASLGDVLQLLAGGEAPKSKDEVQTNGDKAGKDELKLKIAEAVAVPAVADDGNDNGASADRQSEGDRDFRFVRADGKGQPLLLQGERTEAGQQQEPKALETVTVVDSRRYIAPVSTTNAASITAAMLGDSEWVGAMSPGSELANAATQSSQGKVVHTLKLQMTPIELGSVTATLRLSGEELSVQLTVDNPAALRQLSNDQSDILKALRAQGLVVDQVQVNMQVAPSDRSADTGQSGTQSQQSGQQSGQQAFQSGNRDGSERQQHGEAAGNAVRMADERVVQTTDAQASGNRSNRPDQLYI